MPKAKYSVISNNKIGSFNKTIEVDSDNSIVEKLNLGTPKSFVDIQREKLLEKQQNESDSIFDETTKPRRLREDVLRKLFANFAILEKWKMARLLMII